MKQLIIPECIKEPLSEVPKELSAFCIINLTPIEVHCKICWDFHILQQSLPFHEDRIVDPDKTDEWAGMPVCPKCYEKFENYVGELP